MLLRYCSFFYSPLSLSHIYSSLLTIKFILFLNYSNKNFIMFKFNLLTDYSTISRECHQQEDQQQLENRRQSHPVARSKNNGKNMQRDHAISYCEKRFVCDGTFQSFDRFRWKKRNTNNRKREKYKNYTRVLMQTSKTGTSQFWIITRNIILRLRFANT